MTMTAGCVWKIARYLFTLLESKGNDYAFETRW